MWGLLSALVPLLIWAAVAELVLLRSFLRLGPLLPAAEWLLPVYRAVEVAGLAALNLAMFAAAAVVALIAAMLLKQGRAALGLLGALLLVAVAANMGLGALLAILPARLAVALQAASLLAAVLLVFAFRSGDGGRLALALIAASYVLALFPLLAPALGGLGVAARAGGVGFLGEAAAVAAALAAPWSYRPPWRRRDVLAGMALAATLLVAFALRPALLGAAAVWNLSFTLFLPGVLYALALGLFAATVLALRRQGPAGGRVATGLLLIALAGLKLDFAYYALLALAGYLLACQPLAISPSPELARQASPDSVLHNFGNRGFP